ncbi:hypothetical protein COOONC_00389 [Cooperia oncophora]
MYAIYIQLKLETGSRAQFDVVVPQRESEIQVTLTMDNNNGASLSPYTQRSKKGSGDSTAKLMLSSPHCGEEVVNNNGYGAASERTPLKTQCADCTEELRTTSIHNGQHIA